MTVTRDCSLMAAGEASFDGVDIEHFTVCERELLSEWDLIYSLIFKLMLQISAVALICLLYHPNTTGHYPPPKKTLFAIDAFQDIAVCQWELHNSISILGLNASSADMYTTPTPSKMAPLLLLLLVCSVHANIIFEHPPLACDPILPAFQGCFRGQRCSRHGICEDDNRHVSDDSPISTIRQSTSATQETESVTASTAFDPVASQEGGYNNC
ncbi:hypothetical protein I7I51_01118, partial [Histoplasma capsulatum]